MSSVRVFKNMYLNVNALRTCKLRVSPDVLLVEQVTVRFTVVAEIRCRCKTRSAVVQRSVTNVPKVFIFILGGL